MFNLPYVLQQLPRLLITFDWQIFKKRLLLGCATFISIIFFQELLLVLKFLLKSVPSPTNYLLVLYTIP